MKNVQLTKEIEQLIKNENDRAAAKYGKANNSDHESYAVIFEEYIEARENEQQFREQFKKFWNMVRIDDHESAMQYINTAQTYALQAALEWIQVAAMCYKAQISKDDKPG